MVVEGKEKQLEKTEVSLGIQIVGQAPVVEEMLQFAVEIAVAAAAVVDRFVERILALVSSAKVAAMVE